MIFHHEAGRWEPENEKEAEEYDAYMQETMGGRLLSEDDLRAIEERAEKQWYNVDDIPRLVAALREEREKRERVQRELDQERVVHNSTCEWCDSHEEAINRIGEEVGLTEEDSEWSNANSPPDRIQEYIFADKKRIADLKAETAQLRAEVERLRERVGFLEGFKIFTPQIGRHVTIPEILELHPDLVGNEEDYAL